MYVHGCDCKEAVALIFYNPTMQDIALEIAITAARLVVEDGMEYGSAKRRAAKQLGLPARTALPDNTLLESEVREYIDTFCGDTQPAQLRALRELALVWMQRLQDYRPYLGGAVWHGTATRLSDIYLQLFCDDAKAVEIELINQGQQYVPTTVTGLHGEPVEALSLHSDCPGLGETVGLHLIIYDYDDVRGALKSDTQGRSPRGNLAAVKALLDKNDD